MDGVLIAFAVSFGVVFVAELGDKSQLMALTFATRYRPLPVLIGITIATAVVHAVSVAVGYGLGSALPTGWIALVAAIAFFGFGAWTLRGDTLTDDEQAKAERSTGSAVVAASVAFFLAELGDKTMLATITLATRYGWFGTWLGSTLGMVAADALAILVGRLLGRHLPERAIKYGASGLFFVFGVWLLVDASAQLNRVSPIDVIAGALNHHLAGWIALGLGLVTVLLGMLGRRRMRRVGAVGGRPAWRLGTPGWWARALFAVAVLLGLGAPLLVATDVVQPIALFDEPGWVAGGAAVVLLGTALLIAAQRSRVVLQERGADPVTATHGLHARVRNPGLTGIALATAGLLLMVPTLRRRARRGAGGGGGADPGPGRAGAGAGPAPRRGLRRLRRADGPVPAPARGARARAHGGTGPRRAMTGGYRVSVTAPRYPLCARCRRSALVVVRDGAPLLGDVRRVRLPRQVGAAAAVVVERVVVQLGVLLRDVRGVRGVEGVRAGFVDPHRAGLPIGDPCRAGVPGVAISHATPGHRSRHD